MNHWSECIVFWHDAFLGLGDLICSNKVPGDWNGRALRRHVCRDVTDSNYYEYKVQISANFYISFTHSILKIYSILSFFVVITLLEKHTLFKKYILWAHFNNKCATIAWLILYYQVK